MKAEAIDRGFYIDLEKTVEGNLAITLNDAGQAEYVEIEILHLTQGFDESFHRILEDHLANGWENLRPEEIGALTCSPVLSQDVTRDAEGKVIDVGTVYWFPDYQVRDVIEELRDKLRVVFTGVEKAEDNPFIRELR